MNCRECPKSYIKRANLYCQLAGRVHELTQCPRDPAPMKFFRDKNNPIDLTNLYKDQKCFLLGNGPCRNNLDLDLLHQPGVMTMTVNNGGHDFRSNFWCAMDKPRKFMASIWTDPKIMKFVSLKHIYNPFYFKDQIEGSVDHCPNVIFVRRGGRLKVEGWFDGDTIGWNTTKECGNSRCTMLAAIHILWVLGFRTIYIVGADFKMDVKQPYCFPQTKGGGAIKSNNASYNKQLKFFEKAKPELEKINLKLFDAQGTRLSESLPYIKYEEAVSNCVIDTSESPFGKYDVKK